MTDRDTIATELARARARTLGLVDDLDPPQQLAQHSPLMSPLVWDLAHIGNYEELWLLRAIDDRPAIDEQLDWIYNAFEHPRWTRPDLPLLGPEAAREYLGDVRGAALDLLDQVDLDVEEPLRRGGFVYGMVVQHEHQHCETLLATRQLMQAAPPVPGATATGASAAHPRSVPGGPVELAGGTFPIGAPPGDTWAYDNERGRHEVTLAPFAIDATPVTNGRFLEFIDDGGYRRPELWHRRGWEHITTEEIVAPLFWACDQGDWRLSRHGRVLPIAAVADEPVQHVCWFEADAFTRWAGGRLPTETEWERAATWDPVEGWRRYPWGDAPPDSDVANLGQRHDGPLPVGALPAGATTDGVHQLVGDVWEWTSSDFLPYPGFRAFPYAEYSEVFWGGDYKVLRGGSWAADHAAVRPSFRNWDHPIRRQIFAGFRCAWDVTT